MTHFPPFFKARKTEHTCEGETMTITCRNGIIFIEDAMFGRTQDGGVCQSTPTQDTDCTSTESKAIIKSKCDGKSECSINVENVKLGGDPCPGTHKYLEVHYICY